MKKQFLSLLLGSGLLLSAPVSAQNFFDAMWGQSYNQVYTRKPAVGLDLLRTFNPVMISQVQDAANPGQWINDSKYITIFAPFDPTVFSRIERYYYLPATKEWDPVKKSLFSINYDATLQRVLSADAAIEGFGMKEVSTTRYTFNANNQVDSQKVESEFEGAKSYGLTTFEYDQQKLVKRTSSSGGKEISVEYLVYDGQNRLIEEMNLYTPENGTSATDTSFRYLLWYNAENRLSRTESQTYTNGSWGISSYSEYEYDGKGRLIASRQWGKYSDYITPTAEYTYTYTEAGKPDEVTFKEETASDGLFKYTRMTFFYDESDEAVAAFEYEHDGTGFKTAPTFRWFFKDETTTGLNDIANGTQLMVYPNPCKDVLNLPVEKGIFKIQDMSGREVHRISLSSPRVDVSFLQPGFYYVSIDDSKPVKLIRQ